MEVTLERGEGEVPPLDGIAEFKVITSAIPAEYNQPAQVIVISKSGTNQFHGMALEFNRVAATAAKSYFAGALPKPQYIRNEFGGNFSGPVLLPKIYDGRDRSFFFFNYEGFRLIQASNVNSQMPTPAERSGNYYGSWNDRRSPHPAALSWRYDPVIQNQRGRCGLAEYTLSACQPPPEQAPIPFSLFLTKTTLPGGHSEWITKSTRATSCAVHF